MNLRPLTAALVMAVLVVSDQASAFAVQSAARAAGQAVGVVFGPGTSSTARGIDPRSRGLDALSALQARTEARMPGRDRPVIPHIDPAPPGVDLNAPTTTRALYARAGLGSPRPASSRRPAEHADGTITPAGTPSTPGLSEHVSPHCDDSGTDGNRVQVMYLREQSTPSRYGRVLSLLRNEVANVDDVFAVSSAKTGGGRRVRWVHDVNCVPVIPEVVVPTGSLGTNFSATVTALEAQGYNAPNRKYLAFADSDKICGVASFYRDTSTTGNRNDGRYATHARVDTRCWSSERSSSTAAHELVHSLGGVMADAPHATAAGHCTDEADVMCYADGNGVMMSKICPSDHERLLDCNNDDYFSTAPPAGSYLARSWNTASSSFLAVVPKLGSEPSGGTGTGTGGTGTEPEPSAPQPTQPEPTEPGPTEPGPTEPEPTEPEPGTDPTTVETTTWSAPTASGRTRVKLVATLSTAGGAAVKRAPVDLMFQPKERGGTWETLRSGQTRWDGSVVQRHASRVAGWYAFSYAGGPEHRPSRSAMVFTKGSAKLTGAGRAGLRHRLRGRLLDGDGDVVRQQRVVLQRRTRVGWARVGRDVTNRRGVARMATKPVDGATYRWVFRGSRVLHPARSVALVVDQTTGRILPRTPAR